MLGKLIKEDFKSYRMPVGIMMLTAVLFTVFMKIVCILPYKEDIKAMVQILSFYGYYYVICLMSPAISLFVVVRFYSTMVGDRAYLTFTLPVKSSTHIWARLISGSIWRVIVLIATFVLLGIFCLGDFWTGDMSEILHDFSYMYSDIIEWMEPKYIVTIILALLSAFIWFFVPVLLIYMCIAIGQLFGKWRILASFGCYFIIIIMLYVLMLVGMVVCSIAGVGIFENVDISNLDTYTFLNGLFAVVTIVGVAVFAGLFAITNWILKKHLNLE